MKKFLSCLVSIGVLASIMTSFGASSAFNLNKDPNGDGQITMADSVTILDYLAGIFEPSDLTQLDMDDNDVVSNVDEIYVRMYNAGLVNSSIEPIVEPTAVPPTSDRGYLVYNAQTGAFQRSYLLRVSGLDNSNNARQIIGENTQHQDWSNIGVAKIMCGEPNESSYDYLGTGFVVGPHTIATAAHVVFETETDIVRDISDIRLFDESGSNSSVSFTPVEVHLPLTYKVASSHTNINDYALITIEEDLSDYMSFNLGAITDNAINNSLPITVVGFPGSSNGMTNSGSVHQKALSEGIITSTAGADNDRIFTHNADVVAGNSGSPIYVVETVNGQSYNTVVGIHVNLGNTGVRFTPHILKFYKGNSNIQY